MEVPKSEVKLESFSSDSESTLSADSDTISCQSTESGSDTQMQPVDFQSSSRAVNSHCSTVVKPENGASMCLEEQLNEESVNLIDPHLIIIKPKLDGSEETGQLESRFENYNHQQCHEIGTSFNDRLDTIGHHGTRARDKRHACPHCLKTFKNTTSLTYHVKTHTGERLFECPTCSKRFINCTNLTNHIRTHTGERPFECPTCGKRFSASGSLTRHLRSHTGERPYVCPTCGKRLFDSSSLKRHIRMHTGERPYTCTTCNRKFTRAHALKDHIKIHTGERPHKCPHCNKGFIQLGNLHYHLRAHREEQNSVPVESVPRASVLEVLKQSPPE